MSVNIKADILNDAFNVFNDASKKLERQYALLEERIDELNREIAEKNRTMERTRRLTAMGEMAARIAHEIRNPLASIAIFASILERDLDGDSDKKRLASHITKGVKTLDNVVSNMLLFVGSPVAHLNSLDIRDIIDDAIALTGGHDKKGVKVNASFEGQTIIPGDQGLLKQLFLNLFINSFDAMDEGGLLSVRTSVSNPTDGFLWIEVKDDGAGIPKDLLDRIFDPFFSTKERGTGLGLAIVSSIVTAHKGFVDVKSGVGSGTTFVICLPLESEL